MAIFGTSHAEIGAYLLGIWGLSDTIIEAIAWHHDPDDSPVKNFSPLAAVHAADAMINLHTKARPLSQATQEELEAAMDLAFLDRIRCNRHISAWRDMAYETLKKVESDE